MKSLALVLLVACSHDKKVVEPTPSPVATSTAMSKTAGMDPEVDPTLPSWAPASCARYHTAVVRFVGCETEDAARRQSVRERYDAEAKQWQAMHDLPQGAIDEVARKCSDSLESVRAQTAGSCPATRTQPIESASAAEAFPNS